MMRNRTGRALSGLLRGGTVVVLLAVYLGYVFRISSAGLPDSGLGDWIDPYFINFILEHWYYSLRAASDPRSPLMYFPTPGTLGYSNSFILYAPFYVILRPFADVFQAYTLTVMLVLGTGASCLYVLLRQVGLCFVEALLLGAFFITSANVISGETNVWSQSASAVLMPPVLLVLVAAVRRKSGVGRMILAFVAGLLAALVLAQDFYTGALGALLLCLFVGVPAMVTILVGDAGRALGRAMVSAAKTLADKTGPIAHVSYLWLGLAGLAAIAAAILLIRPIERVDLGPVSFSARDPSRPLYVALLSAAWFVTGRWRLFSRIGRASRVFVDGATVASSTWLGTRPGQLLLTNTAFLTALACGAMAGLAVFLAIYLGSYFEHPAFPHEHLLNALRQPDPARWHSLGSAISNLRPYDTLRPFALALGLGILGWIITRRGDWGLRLYTVWFLVISLLILLVPLRTRNISFWSVMFGWLPGLSVIRAPWRIIYAYELAVVLLTAGVMRRYPRRSPLRVTMAVLVLILLVFQWNTRRFDFERPRGAFQERVLAPIHIDPRCRSFFIKGASHEYMTRSPHMWSLYNVDAMFIALEHSIPTLNGYSAWSPAGWGLANPQESGYAAAVNEWIDRHHLRDVCQLDIDVRTMTPYTRPPE